MSDAMMWVSEQLGISVAVQGKLLASLVVVAGLTLTRAVVLRALHQRFREDWVGYRAREVATYTATVTGVIVVAWIWIDAFNDLPTFLGLISAGIAIALSDVLKNLAGWAFTSAAGHSVSVTASRSSTRRAT